MNSNGKEIQPPSLWELIDAQANDRVCTQTALAIRLAKSMYTFDSEEALD